MQAQVIEDHSSYGSWGLLCEHGSYPTAPVHGIPQHTLFAIRKSINPFLLSLLISLLALLFSACSNSKLAAGVGFDYIIREVYEELG